MRWPGKKKLFEFHGWLGLTLGLFLFIICFSGSLAVMSPELDWLAHPQMRITPPPDGGVPLSWGELTARLRKEYPGGTVTAFYKGPGPRSAYQASVRFTPSDARLVFVNPYTGEIQGQSTLFNLKSFFRIFHKQLYILESDYWPHGRVFVCAFSIALLLSAGTALLFSKGWWRSLWLRRLRRGPRVFWSDIHRMAGVWSFLFAILFAVTGLWYLTLRLMEDFGLGQHESFASIPREEMAGRPARLQPLPLDDLIAKALEAYPGFEITGIFPNARPGRGITLTGEGPAFLAEADSNQIHLDPYTGEIRLLIKAHELGLGERLAAMADPLHFGRFGGYLTKIIWTAAGLAISIGILAGAGIWWLRMARGSPRLFNRNRFWAAATMVLNLGLIALAAVSTTAFIGNQIRGPLHPQPAFSLGTAPAGPWEIGAFRHGEAGQGSLYSFHFDYGTDPNFKTAFAWIGQPNRPPALKPIRGTLHSLFFKPAQGTNQIAPDSKLHMEIEGWDGVISKACFPRTETSESPSKRFSAPEPPEIPAGVKLIAGGFLCLLLIPAFFWLGWIR